MAGFVVLSPDVAHAATIVVTSTGDGIAEDGRCSLREAVRAANLDKAVDSCPAGSGADRIQLGPHTYLLAVVGRTENAGLTGDLDVLADLTVVGSGRGNTFIDAQFVDRIFDVDPTGAAAVNFDVANLSIKNGRVQDENGAAIRSKGASLTIRRSDIKFNQTTGSALTTNAGGGVSNEAGSLLAVDSMFAFNGGLTGGGIDNTANAVIRRSTLYGNIAADNGGAIHNSGTLSLTASTLSGNNASGSGQASGRGGGIFNIAGGSASLVNVTAAQNIGREGATLANVAGLVTVRNSILANSIDGENCLGPVMSDGTNLDSGASCELTGPGDKSNVNPALTALDDWDGPTLTHALKAASPAIDSGSGCARRKDQRGMPRPQGGGCDIGAHERAECNNRIVNRFGTKSNDIETGTPGRDVYLMMGGNDTVHASGGRDIVCGGSGNDRLFGQVGADLLLGNDGNDFLSGAEDDDRLVGHAGSDRLIGGSGKDIVSGGRGGDRLYGAADPDSISGGSGRDHLDGQGGRDRCNGGSGRDRAVRCELRSRIP